MLVEQGHVDLAITAQDILSEYPSHVTVLAPLNFGKCQIVLAVLEDRPIYHARDLADRVIATCYPRLTQSWLTQQRTQSRVLALHGSLEIMPALGLATGIVDSYQTGVSARANRLRIVETLMHSQAVLIGNAKAETNGVLTQLTKQLASEACFLAEIK